MRDVFAAIGAWFVGACVVALLWCARRRPRAALERPPVEPARATPAPEPEHYNCRCVTYYQPMAQSGHRLGHPVVTVEAPSAEAAWAALVGGAR
jgi:hypothetical protein